MTNATVRNQRHNWRSPKSTKGKTRCLKCGEIARHKRQRERGMLGFVGFPVVSGIELRHTLHDHVLSDKLGLPQETEGQ